MDLRTEMVAPIPAQARALCILLAAALAIAGCTRTRGQSASDDDRSAAAYGTLAGRITRGPTSPVSRPGAPSSPVPVAGAELKIVNLKGAVVATARADGNGLYRVALPAGNYRVERSAGFSGVARNLPAMVAINPGGQTRLDVWVDTGIRAPGGPAAIR
jgi:hypothetical protein